MAGYVIYSLDWNKFQQFVEHPTPDQLAILARRLSGGLEELDGEFDDGDPILEWPTDAKGLVPIAAARLAMPDWYSDLSTAGKTLWEGAIFGVCSDSDGIDVGFQAENDGIYWDVIELAWKQLNVVPGRTSNVALSAFGKRPYRYQTQATAAKTRKGDEKRDAELTELKGTLDDILKDAKQNKADPNKLLEKLDQGKSGGLFKAVAGFFRNAQEESGSTHDDDWDAMHSMHAPDEARSMLEELMSLESEMHKAKKKDVRQQYDEDLMPALNKIVDEGRMLFVQVDS